MLLSFFLRKTCGGGERTRTRICVGGRVGQTGCAGKPTEFDACSTNSIWKNPHVINFIKQKIIACKSENTGCAVDPAYQYSACRLPDRKMVRATAGAFPKGTTCNKVSCSKQFYGFVWKVKTQKTTCECKNGECSWSKSLHKCPIGEFQKFVIHKNLITINRKVLIFREKVYVIPKFFIKNSFLSPSFQLLYKWFPYRVTFL